jgi:hypothetical protein
MRKEKITEKKEDDKKEKINYFAFIPSPNNKYPH